MNQIPPITKNLLIINVLFFLASIVAPKYGVDLTTLLGLHYFMASDFHIYQFVTYMFMHGGFAHLFFNMFALWMFGCTLERVFGPKRYLIYYMVCGLGAGRFSLALAECRSLPAAVSGEIEGRVASRSGTGEILLADVSDAEPYAAALS